MTGCELHILRAGACYHPAGMARKGAGLCPAEFPALVALILHPTEGAVLFDTGYDPAFFAATESVPERFYRWMTPVKLGAGEDGGATTPVTDAQGIGSFVPAAGFNKLWAGRREQIAGNPAYTELSYEYLLGFTAK